jgi:hypothetical protein
MSYRSNYRRPQHSAAPSGNAPTQRQLDYLNALITQAGMTQDQFGESVGLYESSPWGKRTRTELITRARVSIWIDQLKAKVNGATS